eukprot:GEMP01032262.1.p1 GENE.GEMP01032262.1~~GEMP01032262.1.p1  ORF type:complete len:393 (+),score=137.63 GEMP01032262.1:201-1379(+)
MESCSVIREGNYVDRPLSSVDMIHEGNYLDIPLSSAGLPDKLLAYTRLLEQKVKQQDEGIEKVLDARDDALRLLDDQRALVSNMRTERDAAVGTERRLKEDNGTLTRRVDAFAQEVGDLTLKLQMCQVEFQERMLHEHAQMEKMRKDVDAARGAVSALGQVHGMLHHHTFTDAHSSIDGLPVSSFGPIAPTDVVCLVKRELTDHNQSICSLHAHCTELEGRLQAELQRKEAQAEQAEQVGDASKTRTDSGCSENVVDSMESERRKSVEEDDMAMGACPVISIEEKCKRAQQRVRTLEMRLHQKDDLLRKADHKIALVEKRNSAQQHKVLELTSRADSLTACVKQKTKEYEAQETQHRVTEVKWQQALEQMKERVRTEGRRHGINIECLNHYC